MQPGTGSRMMCILNAGDDAANLQSDGVGDL